MKNPDRSQPGRSAVSNTPSRGSSSMEYARMRPAKAIRNLLIWITLPIAATTSYLAISDDVTPPDIPAISLSADPLYAPAVNDKPVIALALSVEYPTVGAQYMDPNGTSSSTEDPSYTNTSEYLGYYDAESCYTYNKTGSDAPTGANASDYKRFVRSGAATNRMCDDAFSGNFLNWASNSAIDMLRVALTGGDRYIDTENLTILQRAVIPNGDPVCMWNSSNFPAKKLKRAGDGTHLYFGAVPTAMANAAAAAGNKDIWIANTLNRMYFGTAKGGSCTNTSSYNLNTETPQIGTVVNESSLPGDATECASEGGTCSGLSGIREIWYGASNKWKVAPVTMSVSCSNGVFGDPISGTAKKCYQRAYSGSWTPTNTGTALNSDGFFFARVEVCNSSSGELTDSRDYGLCTKYPSGKFKPTGVIQKYSDQLRLAAFGYLMDQTASYNTGGRYGGVLRAPMKYLGYSTYDVTGENNTPTGGNPNAEWNITTGVFNANPDNNTTTATSTVGQPGAASTYLSGVINYVNQFGRTGPVAGRYKKYDPVGELHYEALRYLQGLAPSADAISGLTAALYDGYPVSTTWTDPYAGRPSTNDYSCLKSNIVVIGDINTHDGNRLPTADAANNIPDISAWREIVKKLEKKTAGTYIDGQGATQNIANPNAANNSVPSATGTSQIMGSAYWAHTHDIRGTGWTNAPGKQRPGLRVKTFTFDVNEYNAQANDTTRRTANQFFMAAKYGGFETDASSAEHNVVDGKTTKETFNTKGNPFYHDDMTTANKYVWEDTDTKTSRVGEANSYFLQSDARSVLSAFNEIFFRASSRLSSIAGAAVANKSLTQGGTSVYQGLFDTSDWSGDLQSFSISEVEDTDGNLTIQIGSTPTWSASEELSALSSPATSRTIVVGNTGATANPVAVPFTWDEIGTSLQTSLNKPYPAAAEDGLGQDRLNYIRGSDAKEGNPFRNRNSLLGDIVNSGVAYSGAPTTEISSSSYNSFYTSNKDRTPAVFVGANDGMLHAFDATTGDELFAYIPSWLGPKLSALTNPSYISEHQSYVDSTPVVAEAEVTSGNWKTVLVSGTGGGGQGVFALDVTNPSDFTASNVMWEFTDADDADLGNVTGRPRILKFRTSDQDATTATYKWFAVFASGVNNYVDDGHFSTTGKPALFLLDLSKGVGDAWELGTNYYKLPLPINAMLDDTTLLSTTTPTGAINFSAVIGNAGEVSELFMGDLHGRMWKLSFSSWGSSDWAIDNLSYFKKSDAAYPMFIAKNDSGNVQPITVAPSIASGPSITTRYILFGTGKYLEVSDRASTAIQSYYMVFDNGTPDADSSDGESAISGRSRLKKGTVDTDEHTISVPTFTLGRATTDTDSESLRSGWYYDFPVSKERQISSATLFGDLIVFGSLIPGASATAGTCAASGGSGNEYAIDLLDGNGTYRVSTVGILGEPLLMELSNIEYTKSNSTGKRTKTVSARAIQQGSSGLSTGGSNGTQVQTFTVGRLNWRQINNYLDLKND